MNDLEICKRIAEIEDRMFSIEDSPSGKYIHDIGEDNAYNPLTDKALCFDLMVKYDVRVEPSDCNAWVDNEDGYPDNEVIHHKGTLQEAICLVIINKDNK
ncbi:MAG: hypothetical protein GY829_00160 [Gammaproteobacteria bacterium]|nr:hypothetical protein [Gammaproteobacteria bacterium]